MIKTQFLLLSSILKTRLDEVYRNVFIARRIVLNCPDAVASLERSFSKLNFNLLINFRLSAFSQWGVGSLFAPRI